MKVTIKQIASIVGVSRGTVDRALNNRGGINSEVAEKIRLVAKELGYKPNFAAKALAGNRYSVKKIGILLISEGNDFFEEVMAGVQQSLDELKEFSVESIVKTMKGYSAHRQLELIEELVANGVNGIVLTPINADVIADRINELASMGIKCVTINSDVMNSERIAYVGCQYKKSGCVAAGLWGLMNCGNKEKIGIISGSKKNLAVTRRVQGIVETIQKDFSQIEIVEICENEDSEEISYKVTKELLIKYPDISGICFCAAGVKGGMKAVNEKGYSKKIKIITYDLTGSIRKYLKEEIVAATICQDPFRQGYDGVSILGKSLLFGQEPMMQKNYTELAIITKYSL